MREILSICTRNRPVELASALEHVSRAAPDLEVLVADSSDEGTKPEIRGLVEQHGGVLLDCTPGLARQRNQALAWIHRERPEMEIVHFIDDDTDVSASYFREVAEVFAQRPEVGGVGGVIVNQPLPRHVGIKAFFLLYSRTPGRVLRSGRISLGHYPSDPASRPQCLPGCCMSYRLAAVGDQQFDSRLEGYSWGEDLDFSFRLSQRHPLAIATAAHVVHKETATNRIGRARLASERLLISHRWVRENEDHGMRTWAWWWSWLGEVVLRGVDGVMGRDPGQLGEAVALLKGGGTVLRHPLPAER
jgi:GT2 family glycosyltransferase